MFHLSSFFGFGRLLDVCSVSSSSSSSGVVLKERVVDIVGLSCLLTGFSFVFGAGCGVVGCWLLVVVCSFLARFFHVGS